VTSFARPAASSPTAPAPGSQTAAPDLEAALSGVEQAIAALGQALIQPDPTAIEATASQLQACLRAAMERFAHAARRGPLPAPLRHRFAMASGQVNAQREALFRATSAVDQALDILMPKSAAGAAVYGSHSTGSRGTGRIIAAS